MRAILLWSSTAGARAPASRRITVAGLLELPPLPGALRADTVGRSCAWSKQSPSFGAVCGGPLRASRPVPPSPRRAATAAICFALLLSTVTGRPADAQSPPTGAVAYATMGADTAGAPTVDGLAAVALDGSNPRRLTTSAGGVPQWSPAGRWLAFTETVDGQRRPVAVSAGGSRAVIAEEGADPSWSADGAAVVWTATTPASHLVIAPVQSTDPDLLLGERLRIEVPRPASHPRFSPDGTTLLFAMAREEGPGADLWTVRADGSALLQVTTGVDVSVARPGTHSWSPDGSRVSFLGADAASRGFPRAYLVNADGSGQRLLFPASGCEYQHAAAWAPHGEFLALLQSCQSRGIFIITPEGESFGRIAAERDQRIGGFEFSADGSLLYAVVRRAAPQGTPAAARLLAFPLDGSAPHVLTESPPAALEPIDVVTTSAVEVRVVRPPRDPAPDEDPRGSRSDLEDACPVREVPYADFLDVSRDNAHRLAIDCMAWWDVVRGVAEHAYAPAAQMTRAQMATLLVRMITAGGGTLPESPGDHFDDDNDSVHQSSINRLAEAGALKGAGGRLFKPTAAVRRDHMASFVVAAYRFVSTTPLVEPSTDYFRDDNTNLHEPSINVAAEAGFVAGLGDGLYGPTELERRDQAASRTARVLDALVEQGSARRPRNGLATVTRIVDGDTFLANVPGTGTVRVRLLGMQAPESGTCNSRPSRQSLRDLVLDKQVRLSSDDASSIGKELRPLRFAEVYTDNGWVDVGGEQLRRGHALWLPKAREPRNNNAYQLVVREAMANRVHLWDPMFCGRGPDQDAVLRMWVESNPPGPDRRNLNGEWVRIHNVGATAVDLTGWKLRDSSLNQRLKFATGSVVAPGETMRVHVGSGEDGPLVRYWGLSNPLFTDARRIGGQWVGDGAYLKDTHGDIRASFMYPCVGECRDPLLGRGALSAVSYDPPGNADWANGESITISNSSGRTISLYGYQVRTGGHVYDFPDDSLIPAGQSLTLYVGRGQDTATQKHWGYDTEILDDRDGMVVLRTYDRIRISCWAWGAGVCD